MSAASKADIKNRSSEPTVTVMAELAEMILVTSEIVKFTIYEKA